VTIGNLFAVHSKTLLARSQNRAREDRGKQQQNNKKFKKRVGGSSKAD
jgi:hypothetical protein